MAYERVAGPLGEARGDWQSAMVASTVATMLGKRRYTPEDLLPDWDQGAPAEPVERQTPEEMLAIAKTFCALSR